MTSPLAAKANPGDTASVSAFVAVQPQDAFDVFTREIDMWWKHGPKYRVAGRTTGRLFLEEGVGGRIFETFESPSGASRTIEIGKVTCWEPGARLGFEWRAANFKPGEVTFVDVVFQASGEGTLVTVRHSGWSAIRDDHPARHGLEVAAFLRMMGMWWGSLMTGLREHVAERTKGAPSTVDDAPSS